jgi:hypothetical protein
LAYLHFITSLAWRGRHSGADPLTVITSGNGQATVSTVFQPALDNQFVAFGAHDLFGVGDLRPTQFFSHLRTDLCGIAVDGLPACDDDVGFHVEDGP